LSAGTLIIRVKKEATINEIADEIIKFRTNRIINKIKERSGITENFVKYFILLILGYLLLIQLSTPFFMTFIKISA
jgi:hypothetical protein